MVPLVLFLIDRIDRIEIVNRTVTESNIKKSDLIKKLNDILGNQEDSYRKYLTVDNAEIRKKYLKNIADKTNEFKSRLEDFKELANPKERELLLEAESFYTQYQSGFLTRENLAGLERKEMEVWKQKRDSIINLTHDLSVLNLVIDEDTKQRTDKAKDDSKTAQRLARAVSALAALVSLVFVWIIMRRLSKPLHNLEAGTKQLARGNFSYRITVDGKDELAELAEAFNSMASRLGELDLFKREFLSHISHELKGPLAAIKQVSDLLSDGLVGPVNEKQKRLLKISAQNCRKLSNMLNDLLDISKIEAGVMEYKMAEEDLVKITQACVQDLEPVYKEKNINVTTVFSEPKLVFSFDRMHMIQVITNLLSNAIKFTPEDGVIIIKMDRIENAGREIPERYKDVRQKFSNPRKEYAIVSVRDTGIGIPPEELDKVFQKFYQIKNGDKVRTGTGLGLTISKSIIEAHNGFIWAENDRRQGSCFKFVLPITSEVSVKTLSISETGAEAKL